jgi:hypothetical protein
MMIFGDSNIDNIVECLDIYVNYFSSGEPAFAYIINGKDVTEHTTDYTNCLCVPRNATANLLYMMYMFATKGDPTESSATVTVVDYNLEERRISGSESLC